MVGILWGVAVLLVIFWALGLVFHFAGSLIHALLVIALIVVIFNFVTGRRNSA